MNLAEVAMKLNKRSMDLGVLLDSCGLYGIDNFLQTCIKNSLLQTLLLLSHSALLYMYQF